MGKPSKAQRARTQRSKPKGANVTKSSEAKKSGGNSAPAKVVGAPANEAEVAAAMESAETDLEALLSADEAPWYEQIAGGLDQESAEGVIGDWHAFASACAHSTADPEEVCKRADMLIQEQLKRFEILTQGAGPDDEEADQATASPPG